MNSPVKRLYLCMLITALLISAMVFVLRPSMDLAVAHLFYNQQTHLFVDENSKLGLFFHRGFNNWLTRLVILFIVGCWLGAIFIKQKRPQLKNLALYLTVSIGMAAGVVCNLIFKDNWGRARPRDITQFGGSKEFSPAWMIANQCDNNCAFYSGHASIVFSLLAFALLIKKPIARSIAIFLVFALGCIASYFRLSRGAHFLSDAVTAWLMSWLIIYYCHYRIKMKYEIA
ncbi:MAG: phosphatase PAP2 family protein [Alphaproteobacteria bacterium]